MDGRKVRVFTTKLVLSRGVIYCLTFWHRLAICCILGWYTIGMSLLTRPVTARHLRNSVSFGSVSFVVGYSPDLFCKNCSHVIHVTSGVFDGTVSGSSMKWTFQEKNLFFSRNPGSRTKWATFVNKLGWKVPPFALVVSKSDRLKQKTTINLTQIQCECVSSAVWTLKCHQWELF